MTASAGNAKLKVLFFSQRFPYPLDTGGKIRTAKLLEKLKDVFDITLVSNMESAKDDPYLDQVKSLCAEFHPVPWRETTRYTLRFYLKLFRAMFSRYPFTVFSDYSRALEEKIEGLVASRRFDLLICDFLQPSLNFRNLHGRCTLLFQHNVESMIVKRHFEAAKDPVSRVFWWLQWAKMRRYERNACARFSAVIAVSDKDKEILEREFDGKNVSSIPTGVDTTYFTPSQEPYERDTLVFTGSMDWLPNEDAILFFAREILPKIKTRIPGVKISIVGRSPSPHFIKTMREYPEIDVVGWVDDVRPMIKRHAAYIIPLRIGGGTRIKAYEAMAMGKAVISTSIGVEGLPLTPGVNVVIADDPESFARAVIGVLMDAVTRTRLEKEARAFVLQNVSWDKAADIFQEICRRVVAKKNVAPHAAVTYEPRGWEAVQHNRDRL